MRNHDIIETFIEASKPVMEMGVVFAAKYASGCKRNTVTVDDMRYGLCYSIRKIAT